MTTLSKKQKSPSKARSRKFRQAVLGKPDGVIQPRVQKVGPERFGIVAVDCAKDRSKWMFCDFYGKILVEPTVVEHRCDAFNTMVKAIDGAREQHNIKDLVASVEMTSTYHLPVYRRLRDAGHDTRIIHPFASSHYRLVEHGDVKTDDNDLVSFGQLSTVLA